jgi:hypothetical protein
VQIHRAARASSSVEQKVCLAPLASELHVTFKSGKRQAARWICTSVETRLKEMQRKQFQLSIPQMLSF